MAVRQYIGARYVPEFFSGVNGSPEWVSGVSYEALTIVTRLNNSFTSRKDVPSNIGAPEDNPEYWVNTGNYNSQINQLSSKIDDFEYRMHPKYIIIGASINLSVNGSLNGGFVDNALEQLGIPEDDYYNIAVASAGFTVANNTFLAQLQTAINAVDDNFKAGDVRIIVVGGMNNDRNGGATYLDAVDEFVDTAREAFEHCTIEFMPISYSTQYTRRIELKALYDTYISKMPEHGVVLWDSCYAYMHNYVDWFRDTMHWTETGINIATKVMINVLNKSNTPPNPNEGLLGITNPVEYDNEKISNLQFNNIREYYDGRYVWLMGGQNTFLGIAADEELAVSTNISEPTALCANPFKYIQHGPFSYNNFSEFYGRLKSYNNLNDVECYLTMNASNHLCIYARQPITLAGGQYANLKVLCCIPRELC